MPRATKSICQRRALSKYGAHFLESGSKVEPKEDHPKSRVIVLEISRYAAAFECYQFPRPVGIGVPAERAVSGYDNRREM